MQDCNYHVVKIQIDRRRKKLTQQTIHDNEKLNLRIIRNKTKLQLLDKKMVKNGGKKMNMAELYNIALTLGRIINRKVDRLARRNRKGLLCWLVESCDIIACDQMSLQKRINNYPFPNITQQVDSIIPQVEDINAQQEIFQPENDDECNDNSNECNILTEEFKSSIYQQLYPSISDDFKLPPLINLNGNESANEQDLSIFNLINDS